MSKRLAIRCLHPALALLLAALCAGQIQAQDSHSQADNMQSMHHAVTDGPLLKAVREATAQFKDVSAAQAAGYQPLFGCVSGPDSGAMGLHYVNMALVATGEPDVAHPDVLVYEPTADGHLRLLGADFLILADQWDQAHPGQGAPQIMGQLFDEIDSPNRYGLPRVYTLHVWAWKPNPNGPFALWHANVSCADYAGQAQ